MPADNPVTTLRTDKGQGIEDHRSEINTWANAVNDELEWLANGPASWPNVVNGATAGWLSIAVDTDYRLSGAIYRKTAPSGPANFWDLSAETDTIAAQFRAYGLDINAAGAAVLVAGTNAASSAAAFAALPAPAATSSRLGVYIAGASTDFDAGGGLAAQGTIYNGRPLSVA